MSEPVEPPTRPKASELLAIYLNDHLAGAVAGLELARRSRANNEGTELGRFLQGFIVRAQEDKVALERLMSSLGVRRNSMKQALAWVVEKAGRLKLNGQVFGYSDLSRLEELEGLCLGVQGKRAMWRGLETLGGAVAGVEAADAQRWASRADAQLTRLEEYRLAALAVAFGSLDP